MTITQRTIVCMLGLLHFINSYAQDIETLTFFEKFQQQNTASTIKPILPKEQRLNSKQHGNIQLIMSEEIPDSVRICAEVAADIWSSCIDCEKTIWLEIKFNELNTNNDVQIDVSYRVHTNNMYYPTSLYSHLFDENRGNFESPDATISINKNIKWDCSHGGSLNASTPNMTYALMRAIAISLGFGSSVTQQTIRNKDIIVFSMIQGYSIFDSLIFSSNGQYLKSIKNNPEHENPELTNFSQPTGETFIYALTKDEDHKLYAPNKFEIYKSLIYLNNPTSLMHYEPEFGIKCLQIDNITRELLENIGWKTNSLNDDVEILAVNIEENGIASAYEEHKFYIKNNLGSSINDAQWSYILPLKDGRDTIISTAQNTLSFSTPAIEKEEKYKININGDIYGKLLFTGNINGNNVKATYNLSLELKPCIKKVHIMKKESNSPYSSYNVYYTVEYSGCDHLYIQIEEEYGSSLRSKFVYEPYFAHVVSDHITSPYYAWIDIKAENKYGTDLYTIELPPFEEGNNETTINYSHNDSEEYTEIEIWNENGYKITTINNLNELKELKGGLYILKYHVHGKYIKTTKYYKQRDF